MQDYFIRSSGLLPLRNIQNKNILIVGAGAVGGNVTLALAKMGANRLTVVDFDKVADVNIGPQIYGPRHIGQDKAIALSEIVYFLSGTRPIAKVCKVQDLDKTTPWDIVISCADSMAVREYNYHNLNYKWFLDGRMGAEYISTFCVAKDSESHGYYAGTLFPDGTVTPAPCTEKATSYTSGIIGGLLAKQVKDICTNNNKLWRVDCDIQTLDIDKH